MVHRWCIITGCLEANRVLTSSDSPAPLPRRIRPQGSDDESPACKAPRVVSPVIPGVSTRTASSTIISSATSYAGTAKSYDPPVPKLCSVLYGRWPPILPVSIPLPRFADKNFMPSPVWSTSVAILQYPGHRPRSPVLPRPVSIWMLLVPSVPVRVMVILRCRRLGLTG